MTQVFYTKNPQKDSKWIGKSITCSISNHMLDITTCITTVEGKKLYQGVALSPQEFNAVVKFIRNNGR